MSAGSAPPEPTLCRDIEGLRAVAVILVIGFHVGAPGVAGGFLGVDVFFVISGYLISRSLIAEVTASGRPHLLRFWSRRVLRLMPALTLMVVVVLIASVLLLSPLELGRVADEAFHVATYRSNLLFARDTADYFAAEVNDSLFLHTWSLAVEEQFYVVWPLVLAATAAVAARCRWAVRRGVGVMWLAIGVSSFALAVVLTSRGAPSAFYGLPARAWELAAGGLLCLVEPRLRFRSEWITVALRALGLMLIVAAATRYSAATAHPGVATLVPVAGSVLVIAAGVHRPRAAWLGARPLRFIGRVSYAWYLWHWPCILLVVIATGRDSLAVRSLAAAGSLIVAELSRRVVEDPIRLDPRMRASVGPTLVMGLCASVVIVVGAAAVSSYGSAQLETPFYARLDAARRDTAPHYAAGRCRERVSEGGVEFCELGSVDGAAVVVVGDSHAAHWVPALERLSEEVGVRLIVRTSGACPAPSVRIARSLRNLVESAACPAYRDDTDDLIDEIDPAVVLLSSKSYPGRILDGRGAVPTRSVQENLWRSALGSFVEAHQGRGRAVGVILETPTLDWNPITCAGRSGTLDGCAPDRRIALAAAAPFRRIERSVVESHGGLVLDPIDLVCDRSTCPVASGGLIVYSDQEHLTASFSLELAPDVAAFVEALVQQAG